MTDDLAQLLVHAIEAHRDDINASRIARGEPGRIELHVNPAVRSVRFKVVLVDPPPA